MKIEPIVFNLKNETYTHIGFSAQNVQKAIPEVTPLQPDGYLGLDINANNSNTCKWNERTTKRD